MATKKRAKGKAAKKVARKKVTKSAKGRTGKTAKQPRKPAAKRAAPQSTLAKAVQSTGMADLLRAWSPSRYSTR